MLAELERSFSEIAVSLFGSGTVADTLQRIVDLAEETVEGCDGAGIFVMVDHRTETLAASNQFVLTIDRLQLEHGEGPCLDALADGTTVNAGELGDDGRWPGFSPVAVAAGARSVLSASISTGSSSALNLYAHLPAAFGSIDRAKGQLFATLARLALESAEGRAADEVKAGHLIEALRTRELIGQAQGILMERELITAEQAFAVLRRASQHLNVKLRNVAAALVETGEAPQTGGAAT